MIIRKIAAMGGIAALLTLTSCATLGGGSAEKPLPASIVKELKEAKTIAVLGYNSSKGLDDRLLNDAIKAPLFELKLEIVDERGIKFPIESRIESYEKDLLSKLAKGPYKLVDKNKVLAAGSYKAIKGDVTSDLNNVNAAKGYALTYKFDNFMDNAQSGSNANKVPAVGQVINNFKDALNELGADLGIIVVEKPYVKVKRYAIIPYQLIYKMKDFFGVTAQTTYYIVKPSTLNQVLYSKTINTTSDTTYILKGYTEEQRKTDQTTFLEQYDTVSKRTHDEFIKWLTEQIQ